MEKWDYCSQGQGHSQGSKCQWMFVWMISSESQNILWPNLVWWWSNMSQSVLQNLLLLLLSSGLRSQQGLIWSKYDSFYYIFWTVDSLAIELGLMIHHCKPECHVKKIGYCIQGQGHTQWRVRMLMFVQMISSIQPNILFPNLVLWCINMSQSVMHKDWFVIFKVKVTARAHMIKIWEFLLYFLNCWSFCYQTWFDSTLS